MGLTQDQVDRFTTQGYLPAKNLLDPAEHLDPVIAEYEGVLDRLVDDLMEQERLQSRHSDLSFAERFMRIVAETHDTHSQYFDPSLPQGNIRTDTPIWTGPAVFSLLTSTALLDTVESLIGPEIYSNPVQHVRIKPPEHLVNRNLAADQHALNATSWHQDNGVLTPDADESDILTVWIPLTSATTRHGCLQVIPESHRGGIYVHCPGGPSGLEIPENALDRLGAVPVPLERGDVLFIHKRTAHASLSNVSDEIRWSLDLRYNPTGAATGRSVFPGFVARSRANPASELTDPDLWAKRWQDTRDRLATAGDFAYNRWDSDSPACA